MKGEGALWRDITLRSFRRRRLFHLTASVEYRLLTAVLVVVTFATS